MPLPAHADCARISGPTPIAHAPALSVMPAVFGVCYRCVCGNSHYTPWPFCLSLLSNLYSLPRFPTHAVWGNPLHACHACIRVRVCVCVHGICVSVCVCVCACEFVLVCVRACVRVCVCSCVYASACVRVRVQMPCFVTHSCKNIETYTHS